MSVVFLKAKNRKAGNMDTVPFEGADISVGKLKEALAEKKQVDPREVELSCAQTNKIYSDDRTAIPRNSIINFKKVPIKAAPVGAPGGRSINRVVTKPSAPAAPSVPMSQRTTAAAVGVGTFNPESSGPAAYPDAQSASAASAATTTNAAAAAAAAAAVGASSEDMRIANLIAFPAQSASTAAGAQLATGAPANGGVPYAGYICKRCGQEGHYIKYCPTNGDPAFDRRPVPHGIPLSTLRDADPNNPEDMKRAMKAADGTLKVQRSQSDQMVVKQTVAIEQLPPPPGEYACPICKGYLKDAVIIPCCQASFCDACIRDKLVAENNFACPECKGAPISPDSVIPNKALRTTIEKHIAAQKAARTGQSSLAASPLIGMIPSSGVASTPAAGEQMTLEQAMLIQKRNPKIPVAGVNGNWLCGQCGNVNWAIRKFCNRCPERRPANAGPPHEQQKPPQQQPDGGRAPGSGTPPEEEVGAGGGAGSAADSNKRKREEGGDGGTADGDGGRPPQPDKRPERTCHVCGQPGHIKRDCPQWHGGGRGGRGGFRGGRGGGRGGWAGGRGGYGPPGPYGEWGGGGGPPPWNGPPPSGGWQGGYGGPMGPGPGGPGHWGPHGGYGAPPGPYGEWGGPPGWGGPHEPPPVGANGGPMSKEEFEAWARGAGQQQQAGQRESRDRNRGRDRDRDRDRERDRDRSRRGERSRRSDGERNAEVGGGGGGGTGSGTAKTPAEPAEQDSTTGGGLSLAGGEGEDTNESVEASPSAGERATETLGASQGKPPEKGAGKDKQSSSRSDGRDRDRERDRRDRDRRDRDRERDRQRR